MKYPLTLLTSALALFVFSSCDDDKNGVVPVFSPNGNNDGSVSGRRTIIGKQVHFIGAAETTTVNNSNGFRLTTTIREAVDIDTDYLTSGVSISNGTSRVTSAISSSGQTSGIVGSINKIENLNATYQFGFAPNLLAASIISQSINSSQYITNLSYNSDSTGTYSIIGDEVFNGFRTMTNESGTFEILP